jgi:hypothetical protein
MCSSGIYRIGRHAELLPACSGYASLTRVSFLYSYAESSSRIRFVPKEERSRDNSFLDKERHHWKGIALIVVLGLITLALVTLAVLG